MSVCTNILDLILAIIRLSRVYFFLFHTQDLDDFINRSEHGVILFSLGSVVSEKSFGADKLNNIFEAFAKLKQNVIMKFDANGYENQSSNVKIVKWFPQRDLLGITTYYV